MFSKIKLLGIFLVVVSFIQMIFCAPQPLQKLKLNPDLIRVITEFRKLESKIPQTELKAITTLGIINGAIAAEKKLEEHLTENVADLILNLDMFNSKQTIPKIEKIEKIIERDRSAVQILGTAMDLARDSITTSQYHNEMKQTMHDFVKRRKDNKLKSNSNNMKERLDNLKMDVLDHLNVMQNTIQEKANATVVYLTAIRGLNDSRSRHNENHLTAAENRDNVIKAILVDSIDKNLVTISRREDFEEFPPPTTTEKKKDKKAGDQEAASPENSDDETPAGGDGGGAAAGGGLTGLIASLSGGEEGSDIGALLGAITGLVSQLFGPNGLDVPSLISTATSLIAGLLSGGKNFGLVLGEYFGLALDGLSGGGGADPEDDDEPPKPQIFIENFLNTFIQQARNKKSTSGEDDSPNDGDDEPDKNKGSDSFGFIKHIVKAIVGGVTSFVLNASLGSAGGLSDGSSALLSSSSGGKGGRH